MNFYNICYLIAYATIENCSYILDQNYICNVPSYSPSILPSNIPTFIPSDIPSIEPTYEPTYMPTFIPSYTPTIYPSFQPSLSLSPSYFPTFQPTYVPSYIPTYKPTYVLIVHKEYIIYTSIEPVFIISEFKELFVGNDVMPDNTYIKNKNFGKGNSILVYDGKDYYCISRANISKLNTKKIKGKVIGFMSPIGGSDVSYPQMLTTTHIYSWSNYISEHKLPKNNSKMKILKLLFQAKNPFDIPKKYYNDIKTFDDYYNFPYFSESKIKLKETTLINCGRDGPIESATLFPIGTKKKDEYGITWEVIKGYRDINKWEEYKYYLMYALLNLE